MSTMNMLAPQGLPKVYNRQHILQTQRILSATLPLKSGCRGQNPVQLSHEGYIIKSSTACCNGIYYQRRHKLIRSVEATKKRELKYRVAFWRWRANYKVGTDSMLTMIFLLVAVLAVVLSENTVLAAQRDSIKQKNANKLSSNANAIPTDGEGVGSAGNGNGNGNAISGSNVNLNKYNNDISHGNLSKNASATSSGGTVSANGAGNYVTMAVITTTSTTTATSMVSSSSSSPVSSGGVQKNTPGTSVIHRNAIEVPEDARSGPYFDKAASKNITALLGKTAYLNCRVKNLGNKTMLLQVSWVRHRDIHLLTVGRYTYTSDQRFRAIHQPQTEDWILQIKYPQHRDSGIYECQVSTTPHMSHYIHLNVVEPSTEIIGAPDLYIESGSTINLTCVILNSPEPPAYIFWNHNNAIINYDSPRGGVSVVTNKGETTTSFLLIKSARPSDSGHYQCNPSNAKPKSVTVHVLNGEFPAAMQRAGPAYHRMSQIHYLLVYLSMYLCTLVYARLYMQPSEPTGIKTALI